MVIGAVGSGTRSKILPAPHLVTTEIAGHPACHLSSKSLPAGAWALVITPGICRCRFHCVGTVALNSTKA